MKNVYSFLACCLISLVLLQYRISYSGINSDRSLKITTWDALGYYMYLPATFIYKDVTELKWFGDIDSKYGLSGGMLYQAQRAKNGNYVFKYLGGVAIMEAPFFFIAHVFALNSDYPPDGFSSPYQYALAFGILLYFLLSIFLLRKILLIYFSDATTAITLLLIALATNIIQYVAIDNGASHGPIFPLYVLILYTTIKWHTKPGIFWAAAIGIIFGLTCISRPTEAVMLFIPLLWGTQTKESAKEKWALVKQYKTHIYFVTAFTFVAVLPQLIYWKITTGGFIYDVGSKWKFLNPFFRVIVGWEKGWFIYTPVTILFVAGLFFVKQFPFRKSVIWFCLLNIYIIISWHDWRYGGSYSSRALAQSYPVFALPLAAIVNRICQNKWRFLFYPVALYLIGVNLFQIVQYNQSIIHNNDMNRKYYARIYLNAHPTPLDISLMDTGEWINDESDYQGRTIFNSPIVMPMMAKKDSAAQLAEFPLKLNESTENWLKIETTLLTKTNYDGAYLNFELQKSDSIKANKIRLFSPLSNNGMSNDYAAYFKVPAYFNQSVFKVYVSASTNFEAEVQRLKITSLN